MKVKITNIHTRKQFLYNFPYIQDLHIIRAFSAQKAPCVIFKIPGIDLPTDDRALQALFKQTLTSLGGHTRKINLKHDYLQYFLTYAQQWDQSVLDIKTSNTFSKEQHQDYMTYLTSIWNENRSNMLIGVGYALASDDTWKPHYWLMKYDRRNNVIIDPILHEKFYGYILTYEQCNTLFYDTMDNMP